MRQRHRILVILYVLILSVTSCHVRHAALLPQGYLVKQEGDRLLIGFDDVGDGPTQVAFQWFYFPGMGLIDLSKYDAELVLIPKSDYE